MKKKLNGGIVPNKTQNEIIVECFKDCVINKKQYHAFEKMALEINRGRDGCIMASRG